MSNNSATPTAVLAARQDIRQGVPSSPTITAALLRQIERLERENTKLTASLHEELAARGAIPAVPL